MITRVLHLIADRPSAGCCSRLFCERILQAVRGGVTHVQLRDRESDLATNIKICMVLQERLNVPLIVNTLNSEELACAVGAAGVFIEDDASVEDMRRSLGKNFSVGTRFQSQEAALADYVSIKCFESKNTNPADQELFGLAGLDAALQLNKPLLAIGGIDVSNAGQVWPRLRPGDGIALAGPLLRGDDPALIAQQILGA